MTLRCPTCNEWLVPTASGAVCQHGHGGVFTGVTAKMLSSAQADERSRLAGEQRRDALRVMPHAKRLFGFWTIEGHPGLFCMGRRCEPVCAVKVGEIIALHGPVCYRFDRETVAETKILEAMGIPVSGETVEDRE